MASSDLDVALGSIERVLLDSSTLIAFHNPHEQIHHLAKHVLGRVESDTDPLHAYYSAISASEILVRPLRTSVDHFRHMQAFLLGFPHLTVWPTDLAVAAQVANIRALTRIAFADAFIIATGMISGCEAIITNDEQWKRKLSSLYPAFRWIYLGDYL